MDNINSLEQQLTDYNNLNIEKEKIESSIRELSPLTDEDSLQKKEELSNRLEDINNELALYNPDILANLQNYINIRNRFNELSRDIKAIEELSKEGKRPNKRVEFVTLSSPEGRSKQIDKELASDYMKLVEEKRRLKNEFDKSYNNIKIYNSIKGNTNKNNQTDSLDINNVKEEKSEKEKIREAISNIDKNNSLSLEEKRSLVKEQLDYIIKLSNLPNQGKKSLVTYNGNKYNIPEDLMGIYRFTYIRLRNIDKKIEHNKEKDNNKVVNDNSDSHNLFKEFLIDMGVDYDKYASIKDIEDKDEIRAQISAIRKEVNSDNNIEDKKEEQNIPSVDLNENYFKPADPNLFDKPSIKDHNTHQGEINQNMSGKDYFKPADPKVFDMSSTRENEMYQKLGVPFNKEREQRINELVLELFGPSKENKVSFKENALQKINTAKGYIKTTSKKLTSKLKDKSSKVKNNLSNKAKEVTYTINNRSVKFKENTCQKINEERSKIVTLAKETSHKIRMPFDALREKRENRVTKKDLMETVSLLREQNELLRKQNAALTRKLVNSGGFISTAAFIITVSILITVTIFLVVGFIVFR